MQVVVASKKQPNGQFMAAVSVDNKFARAAEDAVLQSLVADVVRDATLASPAGTSVYVTVIVDESEAEAGPEEPAPKKKGR